MQLGLKQSFLFLIMKKFFSKKIFKLIIASALVMFAAIQLIPVDHSNPPIESEIPASPEVRKILQKACYDCHSHETIWPSYTKIAPASWLIASDVNEGRKELNFSTWGSYTPAQRAKKLKEIGEEIDEKEMPPSIYLIMHRSAALSTEDLVILHKWIDHLAVQ